MYLAAQSIVHRLQDRLCSLLITVPTLCANLGTHSTRQVRRSPEVGATENMVGDSNDWDRELARLDP
jgi:hypothetical protein